MRFKRFLVAMIGGVSAVFLLSACIFTATEYEPEVPNGNESENLSIGNIAALEGYRLAKVRPLPAHNPDRFASPWYSIHTATGRRHGWQSVRDMNSNEWDYHPANRFNTRHAAVFAAPNNTNILNNLLVNANISLSEDARNIISTNFFVGEIIKGQRYMLTNNSIGQQIVVYTGPYGIYNSYLDFFESSLKTSHSLHLLIDFSTERHRSFDAGGYHHRIIAMTGAEYFPVTNVRNQMTWRDEYSAALVNTNATINHNPSFGVFAFWDTDTILDSLPEELRTTPPTEPTEPEYPEYPELPGDYDNDNGSDNDDNGSDNDDNGSDNDDNGDYDYTYPTRLNWWQQFIAWWRSQLFRD